VKYTVFLIAIIVYFSSFKLVAAHSGGTDSYGCHNCYTDECYGDYHCHNGGGSWGGYVNTYLLSRPETVQSGNHSYILGGNNWCNYDLTMNWDKPAHGDRYSISISKYPGADPGPLVDTFNLFFNFKNIKAGKWYVNIKAGNAERWGDIVYWTVDLPKPTPFLDAYLSQEGQSQYLNYKFGCLKEINGPKEFIDLLYQTDKKSSGKVELTWNTPTNIKLVGKTINNEELLKELSYFPEPTKSLVSNAVSNDVNWVNIFFLPLVLVAGVTLPIWLQKDKS
jgi:hypothetical protein